MDFKHKAPPSPQNGNYMESIHHRSPYNQDSMLHHINASKEHYQYQQPLPQQQHNVYEYNDGIEFNKYLQQQHQNMLLKGHYRSPISHRLRRRCRSECLSPSRSPQYQHQYPQERYNVRNGHTNGHQQDMWRMQRRSEDRESPYVYRQQHEILGVDGYKFRFNNLQIDGKSVHLEDPIDMCEETDAYESWNQRRRLRARSESASQDYYFRHEVDTSTATATQDIHIKTREILSSPKEKFSRNHHSHLNHHVTNTRANYSVLVNNTNHFSRYSLSPKSRIRSHHVGHKIGLIRVSSPLHKARSWKNQNSGSFSLPSTESNTPTSSSQNHRDQESDEEGEDDYDEEDPPILPGSNIIDDDMSDPEDNYQSSLSISSSEISSLAINAKMSMISTESVLATGRIHQQPLASSLFPFVPPYITFSTYEEKGPDLPSMIHKVLKWKLTTITPLLVRKVLLNTGFRLMKSPDDEKMADVKICSISEPNDWVGTWGKHMKSPCFKTLHSYQKFNHLPGSFQIGRKDRCWRNLQNVMSRHGKKEFGFMPRTFIIPQDLNLLRQTWHRYSQKNTKWIIKPPASARGTGIKVVNSWSQIPKRKPLIVQRYIERPLLINGSKFDLRLYVLVTSMNPLRCYMHTDGLARFASVKYSERAETLNDRYMHLTNYSINKLSTSYDKNDDANACKGMKWTIKSLWSYLQKKGINTERLWGALRNLVLRTVLAGEGPINSMIKTNLQNKYNAFELFGVDVLLDSELVPWLLEVNISPSLHSASNLDMAVKGPLVTALLNTAMYQIPPKIPVAQQSELSRELNVKMPLCYDKRIYTTTLSKEERHKHHHFTQKTILREDYLSAILENLTPDDIRCLMLTEDELNRCHPLERIFPTPNSYKYLQFTEQTRYYNNLLDAWENRFGKKREHGVALLRTLCWKRVHLKVPPTSVQKDCGDKQELGKITEGDTSDEPMQTSTTVSSIGSTTPIDSSEENVSLSTKTKTIANDPIDLDSNENRDISNIAADIQAASPKNNSELSDSKYHNSNMIPCLDTEIILVEQ